MLRTPGYRYGFYDMADADDDLKSKDGDGRKAYRMGDCSGGNPVAAGEPGGGAKQPTIIIKK